jgi:uncharacterized protein
MKMETDVNRFRRIVRGRIKDNLKKYISSGELIGRQGKKQISIPLPRIDLPRFQFGSGQGKGVGQGDGEVGDQVGQGQPQPGEGEAGESPGEHGMDIEVSLQELADILGEELQLPRIEDKGKKNISSKKYKYHGVLRTGPEGLRNFKRTYKEAIKRQIGLGEYFGDKPTVIPIKEDKRYKCRYHLHDGCFGFYGR